MLKKLNSASLNEHFFTRTISHVLYHQEVRPLWDKEDKKEKLTGDKIRYWQIAPKENARLWEDFLDNSIGVGYKEMNSDLTGAT